MCGRVHYKLGVSPYVSKLVASYELRLHTFVIPGPCLDVARTSRSRALKAWLSWRFWQTGKGG